MAGEGRAGAKVGGHQASWAGPCEVAAVEPLYSWSGVSDGTVQVHGNREILEGPLEGLGSRGRLVEDGWHDKTRLPPKGLFWLLC